MARLKLSTCVPTAPPQLSLGSVSVYLKTMAMLASDVACWWDLGVWHYPVLFFFGFFFVFTRAPCLPSLNWAWVRNLSIRQPRNPHWWNTIFAGGSSTPNRETHTLNSPCSQHLKVVESTAAAGLRLRNHTSKPGDVCLAAPSKLLPPFLVAGISSTTLLPRQCFGRNPRATVSSEVDGLCWCSKLHAHWPTLPGDVTPLLPTLKQVL